MFSFKTRTVVATILFALALGPTATADDWYRDAWAAKGAQVSVRPDDKAGPRGVGATDARAGTVAVRPDDRAGLLGVGAVAVATEPTIAPTRPDDRAGTRGPGATRSQVLTTSSDSGFDWGDAGIGALGGFGVALLTLGVVLLAKMHGRDQHVPA